MVGTVSARFGAAGNVIIVLALWVACLTISDSRRFDPLVCIMLYILRFLSLGSQATVYVINCVYMICLAA